MSAPVDRRPQPSGQFALLLDALENCGTPLFQFAQINQPLLQIAQLSVVETSGRFFAIARDERHGSAFIEQRDRRHNLLHRGGQLLREAIFD